MHPHGAAQDLARAGLGQAFDHGGGTERGDRTDAVADQLHQLADDRVLGALDAGIEHREADRDLALEAVGDADHRAFGHIGMGRQHLFHAAGGEAMAGDVDDVVGAAHDVEVAVLVPVAGIGGLVVAGKVVEIGAPVALVVVPTGSAGNPAAAAA